MNHDLFDAAAAILHPHESPRRLGEHPPVDQAVVSTAEARA